MALRNGWRIFAARLGLVSAFALLYGIPGGLLSWAVTVNEGSFRASMQVDRLYSGTVGLIFVAAMVVAMIEAAEGGKRSFLRILGHGVSAWPNVFAARFRAGLWILLFTLLLIIPGIVKALSLCLVTQAALRSGEQDALEASTRLTRGYRWHLLGTFTVAYLPVLVLAFVVGTAAALVSEMLPVSDALSEVVADVAIRLGEGFVLAVGLAAFYGLKNSAGEKLAGTGPVSWE